MNKFIAFVLGKRVEIRATKGIFIGYQKEDSPALTDPPLVGISETEIGLNTFGDVVDRT